MGNAQWGGLVRSHFCFAISPKSINRDDQEADEGEDEGEVYGGVVHHRAEVNDGALEGRHDGTAHNGHDEEGSTE